MSSKIKSVALVEWSWMGHHPMYFKLYIRALLELGCTVFALCPDPADLTRCFDDLDPDVRSRLTVGSIKWAPIPDNYPIMVKRTVQTIRSFYQLRKIVRRLENENGVSIELLFFACIYDVQFRHFRRAEWLLPWRWSGLYLHCRFYRMPGTVIPQSRELPCPERFFRSKKLHSIAVLDEGAITALEELSGRPVIAFPDLTDETLGSEASELAIEIKKLASGSPIVAVLGNLQYTKGVTTLARLALDPRYSDLCFAFIGQLELETFSINDQKLLVSLMDRSPNTFTHFSRVPDEAAFNSLVGASDVIFAAYFNFPNSSGIMTKAAVFRKPVIVSDGYLMAERVKDLRIGEVVPEGDADATGRAVRIILDQKSSWRVQKEPKWGEYCDQHSYRELKASFSKLLTIN